jgi:hypothetical protein
MWACDTAAGNSLAACRLLFVNVCVQVFAELLDEGVRLRGWNRKDKTASMNTNRQSKDLMSQPMIQEKAPQHMSFIPNAH